MNSINETANQVDRLIGLLTACMVNWPDTEVRVKPSIELYKRLITRPDKMMMDEVIEDLIDLRHYFLDLSKHIPELESPFSRIIEVLNWLLGNE